MWMRAPVRGNLLTIVSPQHDNFTELRWPSWESLLERTTNKWSSTSRRYAWDRRQQDDLGNIHVRDTEGGGRFLARLSIIFTFHQDHGIRAYQTIVWYFTEIDQWSKSRFIWNIYNWGGRNSIGVQYFVRSKFHQVTQHSSEFQNSKQRWKKIKFGWTVQRSNHLHVDVQWHWFGQRRKPRRKTNG